MDVLISGDLVAQGLRPETPMTYSRRSSVAETHSQTSLMTTISSTGALVVRDKNKDSQKRLKKVASDSGVDLVVGFSKTMMTTFSVEASVEAACFPRCKWAAGLAVSSHFHRVHSQVVQARSQSLRNHTWKTGAW